MISWKEIIETHEEKLLEIIKSTFEESLDSNPNLQHYVIIDKDGDIRKGYSLPDNTPEDVWKGEAIVVYSVGGTNLWDCANQYEWYKNRHNNFTPQEISQIEAEYERTENYCSALQCVQEKIEEYEKDYLLENFDATQQLDERIESLTRQDDYSNSYKEMVGE